MRIKTEISECWKNDLMLRILTIATIALFIASFIVPPLGVIDGSVLAASGIMTGLGVIWEFNKALNKNIDAKVKIREMELMVGKHATQETNTNTENIEIE